MQNETFYAPRDFVSDFDLEPGSYVADFGSGSGEFAIEVARQVGHEGRGYAFDIRTAALQTLKGKARSRGFKNIRPIRADLEEEHGSGLPDQYVDVVLIHNIIFQVPDKAALLAEAKRVLKPEGRVLAVEWTKHSPIGPPKQDRIGKDDLIALFEAEGIAYVQALASGDYHYSVLFKKAV
ncbi:MAG: hypothetical protein BRC23_02545 [Parcubacteria group bacterium SW_4_49_11]|nr:MAG: hypothetical protein BRC23_02545 [Parcubacteria group bacterium SW_4_49_11]